MTNWQIKLFAQRLRDGGVIAYPTETVYGLGCDPLNSSAVARLLTIKQRAADKGFILIASDYAQLSPYVDADKHLRKRVKHSTVEPVTWLLPASPNAPAWITGNHSSVAVRITSHPLAAQLCHAFGGAIVSTSANLSGQPPARKEWQVRRILGAVLDDILVGQSGPFKKPSEIRDAITGHVIRQAPRS